MKLHIIAAIFVLGTTTSTSFKVQENNQNFPFDQLKEVEEGKGIPPLYEEAKSFLYSHKWCIKVKKGWYDKEAEGDYILSFVG